MCFEYFHIHTLNYLNVVAKEDPETRTVGGRVLPTVVYNFQRVSAFCLLLVFSEYFTDVHLKTAEMIAFDDAPYIQ